MYPATKSLSVSVQTRPSSSATASATITHDGVMLPSGVATAGRYLLEPAPALSNNGGGNGNNGRRRVGNGLHDQPPFGDDPNAPGHAARRRKRAVLYWDAPNADCHYCEILGGRLPSKAERIDQHALRTQLSKHVDLRKCEHVVRQDPRRDRKALREYLYRIHWKIIEARRATSRNDDPVDCYIIERINTARSTVGFLGPDVIFLATHDGDYHDVCRAWLQAGGELVLLGFLPCFNRRLYHLTQHPLCRILDLRYDFEGVIPPPPPPRSGPASGEPGAPDQTTTPTSR